MALTRSQQMARIKSRNTSPEMVLRSALFRAKLRFRIGIRTPAGVPDIVFPSKRVAVYIDGCFWHGCPEHYLRPRTRESYWAQKLRLNVERDRRQTAVLEEQGWRVCRVWEHEVFERIDAVVQEIASALRDWIWNPPPSWRVLQVEATDSETLEVRYLCPLRGPVELQVVEAHRAARMWSRQTATAKDLKRRSGRK